jgi:hypothetical protein
MRRTPLLRSIIVTTKPVTGHVFSIGCAEAEVIVGVAIVGRPVARMRDDGVTAEVTRLCTDGTRNACSFLYGAASRAAFALGFKRNRYLHPRKRARHITDRRRVASNWRGAWSFVVLSITPARRQASNRAEAAL